MSISSLRGSLLAVLALLSIGCGGSQPDTIERQTFVDTYVDLRTAALQSRGARIPPERRDEILAAHGVSEEDLLRFAEVHGRDVEYMSALWSEVEARLQPPEPTQGSSGSTPP